MWEKGLTIGTGQVPAKKYHQQLRDLIISGKAKPSFIVSDHCSINDAPDAYAEFSKRDKMTKPIIHSNSQNPQLMGLPAFKTEFANAAA